MGLQIDLKKLLDELRVKSYTITYEPHSLMKIKIWRSKAVSQSEYRYVKHPKAIFEYYGFAEFIVRYEKDLEGFEDNLTRLKRRDDLIKLAN